MRRQGIKEASGAHGKKKKKSSQKQEENPQSTWSANQLLEKAEELAETYNPELAQKFYERGLQVDPTHTALMDSYAQFLLDLDDFERAKELLLKSIELSPEDNWIKYMNLGQLLQGSEAFRCYNKGIELMFNRRSKIQSGEILEREGELEGLAKEIASALCSQAELFMTDACFEENAESECEGLLNKALEVDPSNAETLQTMANFRLCQQKNDEALQLLNRSYDLWKDADDLDRPSMELCHNTAKMFLELEQDRIAADIWESLLDVDDNIAEIHYYLGLAYRYISTEAAKECLGRAKELLLQCSDPQLMSQVNDILSQVEKENYEEEDDEEGEDAEDTDKKGHSGDDMDV